MFVRFHGVTRVGVDRFIMEFWSSHGISGR